MAVGDRYYGTTPDIIKKASCVFGGGVGGCRKEMCGALGGGVVILGALFGRDDLRIDDKPINNLVAEWRRRFLDLFGETMCEPIRDRVKLTEPDCLSVVLKCTPVLVELIEEALRDDPAISLD